VVYVVVLSVFGCLVALLWRTLLLTVRVHCTCSIELLNWSVCFGRTGTWVPDCEEVDASWCCNFFIWVLISPLETKLIPQVPMTINEYYCDTLPTYNGTLGQIGCFQLASFRIRQAIAVSDISIYICLIDIRSKSKEQLNERRAGLSNLGTSLAQLFNTCHFVKRNLNLHHHLQQLPKTFCQTWNALLNQRKRLRCRRLIQICLQELFN